MRPLVCGLWRRYHCGRSSRTTRSRRSPSWCTCCRRDDRIGAIRTASNGPEALKILQGADLDVVFCDIKMPGLDGIDLARAPSKFASRPQIVFVTAYDEHAVQAFELRGHRLRDEAGPPGAAGRSGPPRGQRPVHPRHRSRPMKATR